MTPRIVAATLCLSGVFAANTAQAAFTRSPWIQDATKSSVAIYWEAGSNGGTQRLDYGTAGGAMDQSVTGVNVQYNLYKAVVTNLPPSAAFGYRVVSNADTSVAGTFVTAPATSEPFRFGAYGDTRSNATPHAAVIAEMVSQSPDLVIIPGDLVNFSDYNGFFAIEAPLLRNTPVFPAPGNHDFSSFYQFGFDRPNWYSFRWGNTFFLSLSSEDDYSSGSSQHDWAEAQLTAARQDESVLWIVAYHHRPVYSSANHGSTANMQTSLNALYKTYDVDLVISSHDHVYERIEADDIAYFVTGGGGADLYDFGTPVTGSMARVKTEHLIVVDIDGNKLDLQAIDTTGAVIDTYHAEKAVTTTPTPTPTGTNEPTPTPTGDPGDPSDPGEGGSGSCAVAATSPARSASVLFPIAGLAAFFLATRRRRG